MNGVARLDSGHVMLSEGSLPLAWLDRKDLRRN